MVSEEWGGGIQRATTQTSCSMMSAFCISSTSKAFTTNSINSPRDDLKTEKQFFYLLKKSMDLSEAASLAWRRFWCLLFDMHHKKFSRIFWPQSYALGQFSRWQKQEGHTHKKHVHKSPFFKSWWCSRVVLFLELFQMSIFKAEKVSVRDSNPMDNIVCNVQLGLLCNMSSHKVGKRSRRDQQLGTNNITTKQKRIRSRAKICSNGLFTRSHRAFFMNF